jgi:hypothetical protein
MIQQASRIGRFFIKEILDRGQSAAMKPLTQEWIEKAEGDFRTARRELQAKRLPNYDAVCFHAQQCAEKYLKARLCKRLTLPSQRFTI